MKTQSKTSTMNRFTKLILTGILVSFTAVFGQDSGQLPPLLDSISPTSAEAGTTGLSVTFTLSSDVPVPPDEVTPTAAALGTLTGSSITRVDSYTVTAVFSIPEGQADDTVDASVTFPGPEEDVSFILPDGFSIGAGAGGGGSGDTENGLVLNASGSYEGYTLLAPNGLSTVYLLNHDGAVAHQWACQESPSISAYLLDDGTLLRSSSLDDSTSPFAGGGAASGSVERYAKDGTVLWQYELSTSTQCSHHDIEYLPNGNVLLIVWELKTEAEAIAAGRDPDALSDGELWPDSILEIEPSGTDRGTVVWEWHMWDHLVQDYDAAKDNYGVVADHPELIDLNYYQQDAADWTHVNAVDYNEELDQIIISVHNFGEIWIIDHSTTIAESSSHSGGNSGKGGDLLYRWGNPQTYGRGDSSDQALFGQHDAQWIEAGLPGESDILVFNNGQFRTGGNYSSIDEFIPPFTDGTYTLSDGSAYGPDSLAWTYTAETPGDFFADHISGAQRLPNGNTLICDGPAGTIFEVTDAGETVWEYVNPYTVTTPQGDSNEVFRAYRYGMDSDAIIALNPENKTSAGSFGSYPIVDTAQTTCYDNTSAISAPAPGEDFYGQDAQFTGNQPSYTVSADGLTVHDNVTGLTWTQSADLNGDGTINIDDKLSQSEAAAYVATLNAENFGGFSDWRLPSIKEVYSLMDFRGTDPMNDDTTTLVPFIDGDVFGFGFGDTDADERTIDSQLATTAIHLDTVMGGQAMSGLNIVDGRIKGYPVGKDFYVYYCRGNTDYGINDFVDNEDGTITDNATGLMWDKNDSGDGENTGPRSGMLWKDALAWVQTKNAENYLGHSDWRLPNAKELQSIVDYSRAPTTTSSSALDPIFNITQITNEGGEIDWPWFWTSTTHKRQDGSGNSAVYICFGRAMGYWDDHWDDVHGSGAQRSDGKEYNTSGYTYVSDGWYFTQAPQGDAARWYNYVRLVRTVTESTLSLNLSIEPNSISEADGEGAATATVTRNDDDLSAALTVTIASDDTGKATVPETVTIPADQASVTFSIDAVDDSSIDGTQAVTISVSADDHTGDTATLQVTDDDALPTLTVNVETTRVSESDGEITATLSRSDSSAGSLVVLVTSSDTTEATVPSTVSFENGESSITFTITLQDDDEVDGTQSVTITCGEEMHESGSVTLSVTDDDGTTADLTYPVVDTGQTECYNATSTITAPASGAAFYGQDAQHDGNLPSYTVSGDGLTVYDNVTGLTWTRDPDIDGDGDIDVDDKVTFAEAPGLVATLNAENYGGYSDWRVPTTKELYSLIDFRGTDPPPTAESADGLVPFIDTNAFIFGYGDVASDERIIDSQWVVSTLYTGTVMNGVTAMFGVNFADGRIKGYPNGNKTFYVRVCRGNPDYGVNAFSDNDDGTITDSATGLMWSRDDNGTGVNWQDALAYAQTKNDENYLGYSDWRLPNAKELQSIVDYTRSPDATGSAAIDPLLNATQITNEAGNADYGFYWSSTTHVSAEVGGRSGAYVAFGRGLGSMDGTTVIDVHGSGCQRSDPKDGDADSYPNWGGGLEAGLQGDVQRVFNYVRLVRNADTETQANVAPAADAGGPYTVDEGASVTLDGSASTDSDGTIVSYEWDLDNDGDYDDATGVAPSFCSEEAGTYTVGLRVTDDEGATGTDTAAITVEDVPVTNEWTVSLDVANASVGALAFGIHPDASDGLDAGYDSLAPPPAVSGLATVAFISDGNSLESDIRGTLDGSTWTLVVNSALATSDGTITVDGDTLPDANLYIWELDGTAGQPIAGTSAPLSADTEISFSAGESRFFAIAALAPPIIILDTTTLTVPEGGTAAVQVKLSRAPGAVVVVDCVRSEGDSDLDAVTESALSFDDANWDDYQIFTIGAAEDGDTTDDTAILTFSADGLADVEVSAAESDDDVTLTIAVDGNGSTTPAAGDIVVDTNDDLPLSISATPDEGYDFLSWSSDPSDLIADSASSTTTANVTTDASIVASFITQITVNILTPGTGTGLGTPSVTVSGTQTVAEASSLVFLAIPQGGTGTYSYAWTIDGETVGSNSPNFTYSPGYDVVSHPDTESSPKAVVCTITDTRNGPSATVTWEAIVVEDTDRAPSAPVISITPESPTTTDDLNVEVTTAAMDEDGDSILEYHIQWSKVPTSRLLVASDFVDADRTTKDDVWKVTVTPVTDPYGTGTVTGANSTTASVTVGNTVPVALAERLLATPVGVSLSIQLAGEDIDFDEGIDTLSFDISGYSATDAEETLESFDSASGSVTYAPPEEFLGPDSFTFTVSDGDDTSAEASVDILVYDGWLMNIVADSGETVQFGVMTGATTGIDDRIDVEAALSEPVFFLAPGAETGGLLRDMRPQTEGAEWILTVVTGDSAIALSWDMSSVPEAGLIMQDATESETPVLDTGIDMGAVSSCSIPAGSTAVLSISAPPIVFELALAQKWNLASVPIIPDNPTVEAVLDEENIVLENNTRAPLYFGKIWKWDPTLNNGAGQYVSMTEFVPCEGCWIYTSAAVSVNVTGQSQGTAPTVLVPGWNLVGVAEETVFEEIPGVYFPGWAWDTDESLYVPVNVGDTLHPGAAYWIYTSQSGSF